MKILGLKEEFYIVLLITFVLISLLYISPFTQKSKTKYHSTQLTKNIEKSDNSERTEYRNSSGKLTIAADLGYASISVTRTESGLLETYYDDQNEPVCRSDGYYAVLREYNEKGNNIRNTYLDDKHNPMITRSGYAIQEREFNDQNQVVAIRYFDAEGNPVCTAAYGFLRMYEYDETGNNNKITYCDASGRPMVTTLGYASVIRHFYTIEGPAKGKVESEFYFDENGMPISLSLGQYGVHKEYNDIGQDTVLTYLDADGNPMITNKGYTTVVRTFQGNNYVASELYFDLEGKPYFLSEGQYGIKRTEGQTVYLDQNGKKQFNLRNLLYNHTRLIIPLSFALFGFSTLLNRKWNMILLTIYLIVIVYLTLMFREREGTRKIELLWYYKEVFTSSNARADILKNIWLFIPFGAILYHLYPERVILLVPIALSIVIEGIQYITGIGFCELDDVISNGIGGWIGFAAGEMATDIKLRIGPCRYLRRK